MATMVKQLYLTMQEWGTDKGKLEGSVTFCGAAGEVKVRINNDQAARIMLILADELVNCAQETATLMRSSFIEEASTLALES